ncbi:MAG: hypothetical protein PUB21_06150 [Bacteroidales bacterium]|nr:hypothetical protein [Bacteroidales bacterium]
MSNRSHLNGRELLMSISGVLLICFLIVHLCFNLSALFGEHTYNNVYSYISTHPGIQIISSLLGLGFILHILSAFFISAQQHYSKTKKAKREKGSFYDMLILGLIVLGFGGMHLAHFWHKTKLLQILGKTPENTPYELIAELFSQPLYVVMYLVWIIAVWLHLSYGIWNIFDTISSKKETQSQQFKHLKWISIGLSTVIAIGFAIIPLWFSIGLNNN